MKLQVLLHRNPFPPGLGQLKAGSWEVTQGFPDAWQEPTKVYHRHCLLSFVLVGSWIPEPETGTKTTGPGHFSHKAEYLPLYGKHILPGPNSFNLLLLILALSNLRELLRFCPVHQLPTWSPRSKFMLTSSSTLV